MRRSSFLIPGVAGFALALQGCVSVQRPTAQTPAPTTPVPEATPPPAPPPPSNSSGQCQTQNPTASTAFRTLPDGSLEWTLTFDAATTNAIESHMTTSEDGQRLVTVNELDCLVDQELRKQCPRWRYREPFATDLPNGRLEAHGICGH